MAALTWPATLPQRPQIAGFGEVGQASKVSYQPDQGPPIERPRGTMRLATINTSFVMTDEQVETFKDFVQDDLAQGSLEFYMPHPRTGRQAKVKIGGGGQAFGVKWHGRDNRENNVDAYLVSVALLVIG